MMGAAFCGLVAESAAVAQQKPELVVQTGHGSAIHAIACSPDGRFVASVGTESAVKLWDLQSGLELRTLQEHGAAVQAIAFSPDQRLLATAGNDRVIRLWDIATGRMLRSLPGRDGVVTSLEFSRDGRELVSGATDDTIVIWDPASGTAMQVIAVGEDHGEHDTPGGMLVALSPDGRTLASGGKTTRLWDVATGKQLRVLRARSAPDTLPDMAVAFSPDGRTLATSGRTMRLVNVDTGRTIWDSGPAYDGPVESLAFSADGKSLIGGEGEIMIWDAATGKLVRTLVELGEAAPLTLCPEGRRVIVGGGNTRDYAIRVFDTSSGAELRRLTGHTSPVTSLAFSSDGRLLAAGRHTNIARTDTIKLWDLASGQMLRSLNGTRNTVRVVAFSGNGHTLASGGGTTTMGLWDSETGHLVREIGDTDSPVHIFAYTADGHMLASGDPKGTIRLWDTASGKRVRELSGHARLVDALAFSPDGTLLASGGSDQLVRIWDAATGEEVRTLSGHTNGIRAVAFSPDGRLLASSGLSQQVILWDVRTGQAVRTLPTFSGPASFVVNSLAFSPDGRLLTAGITPLLGEDGGVLLWDVATGKLRSKLPGATSAESVAFSGDGRLIAAGGADTNIRLWDAPTGRLLASLLSVDEDDWLVVTPDGLFDGSPAAWSQIHWRFSPQLFDVAPVELFFNEYYYPGLLAELVGGKHPRAITQIEQKDRRQPQLTVSAAIDSGGKSTEAGIGDPVDTTTARRARVKVHITAALAGAQDARLFRNGSLIKAWRGDVLKGQSQATLEADVAIMAGPNRFSAYAFNRDNVKSTDATLTVAGAASLARAGTLYLLAIGIDHYANPQFDLAFAVADATDFAAEFRAQQAKLTRYPRVELIQLNDQQATHDAILGALARVAAQAQPEDAVVVYYAGHGTAEKEQFFLIPHDLGFAGDRTGLDDAGMRTVLAHSVSDRDLERALEGVNAGRILLVIDACNSGQALEASEKRRGPMNSKGLAQLAYEKGMYVLAAAQSYQAAIEPADLAHGLLTYALVEEGLKRWAADFSPKDGAILLREWLEFATERVPQLQVERMRQAGSRGIALAYVEGEERVHAAEHRNVQRPRAFYRRELDSDPFVVQGMSVKP